ncbi:PEGA domain-containing protein, partial [bacterium]|nr:PEGA domain-containing protein [bacterium]
ILPNIAASKEFVDMLVAEAKIAVMLNHGNIAQIYDLGKVKDDYFIVMEYVDGKSLSQIHKRSLKHGHLIPLEHLCYCIAEVASGLDYMHRRADDKGNNFNIIHRDISPQNVIISYSGTVKIIDFGIAKAATKIEVTESGVLKGKFAYMSPEYARGEKIDHRLDIFSLGVVLHELLTGKRLFKAEDNKQTIRNVRKCQTDRPSELRNGVPQALDEIVMKSLCKDPRGRYQWASEMRNDLLKFLHKNYPEYRPEKLVNFLKEIFTEELESKELEETQKTPFMIIDQTHSAIKLPEYENGPFGDIVKTPTSPEDFIPMDDESKEEDSDFSYARELSIKSEITSIREKITKKVIVGFFVFILSFTALFLGWKYNVINEISEWYTIKTAKTPSSLLTPATLKLETTPEDVQIYLNEKLMGYSTPLTIGNLTPDTEHTLRILREGYKPYIDKILFSEKETRNISIILDRVGPVYGTIDIKTEPAGATVYIDDTETNYKTPTTISEVSADEKHKLGLFYPNYKFWQTMFDVGPDAIEHFQVQLAIDYGQIDIKTTPPGAEVLLNEKFIGVSPLKEDFIVPGRTYTVTLSLPGYKTWRQEVKVHGGKTLELFPVLEKMR